MQQAKQTIYTQEMPLAVKHSAWFLFNHQLSSINPKTSKQFSEARALSNTLKWIRDLKERRDDALLELSPMQKTILRLMVVEGLTQKEIELRLQRRQVTIKRHCAQIKRKLGVVSMYQAVALAVELGLVNAPQMEK